jgi:transcription elongation factor Elf1
VSELVKKAKIYRTKALSEPVYQFVEWVCGPCTEKNVAMVHIDITVKKVTCSSCGAESKIYLKWGWYV